jgi:hypothetical protein
MPAPKPSWVASLYSLPILPPTRRTRALALKKLRRICQAEVRRIFFSAKFSLPKKKLPFPALIFEGQLKTRQAPGTSFEPYPIPVLAEPKKIIGALDQLRALKTFPSRRQHRHQPSAP